MPFQKQWSSFAFQYSTIFGYWNCFLSSVGKDGKDGRGLKLEKNGGFNAMSFKNLQKYSYGYYSQLKLFEYG